MVQKLSEYDFAPENWQDWRVDIRGIGCCLNSHDGASTISQSAESCVFIFPQPKAHPW